MIAVNIILYIGAFAAIWFGSGLIVSSVDTFSKKLRLSSFAISFILLGLLTSTPEFAVGLQAVSDGNSEIFIGNLIGSIPVLFLLVIPLLAVLGNGIQLRQELDRSSLLTTLSVILLPSLFILDKRVSIFEAIICVAAYALLIFLVQKKKGLFHNAHGELLALKAYSHKDMLKILLGIAIVFVSSHLIVQNTLYFAELFGVSVFYISMIVVSLGTNLPELSLAIRSVLGGARDVAMGDYMGSAAVNTLFFGVFTLLSGGTVATIQNFLVTFLFVFLGLLLFYFFSGSRSNISRREGFAMLCAYIGFLVYELLIRTR